MAVNQIDFVARPRTAPPEFPWTRDGKYSRPMRLRLAPASYRVGTGQHRSGWPYALRSLGSLFSDEGVLFDDFVERSFSYAPISQPYQEPWIGIFHHPPRIPPWILNADRPQNIFRRELWRKSKVHLKLAIALSRYHADFLANEIAVPTAVVTHPTETPPVKFSEELYLSNASKQVVQVGWYLRNTRAIYQLQAPASLSKALLDLGQENITNYEARVRDWWGRMGTRRENGTVERIPRLNDADYDDFLSKNVVFLELLDASANNAVVECIVRNTPLVVNRHPALEEYLGRDYPLFYDRLDEAGALLTDEKIISAHRYLLSMEKAKFQGATFARDVARICQQCLFWQAGGGSLRIAKPHV